MGRDPRAERRHDRGQDRRGKVRVNGVAASPRDGIAIIGETRIEIEAQEDSELVLVDAR